MNVTGGPFYMIIDLNVLFNTYIRHHLSDSKF